MRVLIVDDELFICELLDEYLSLQGFQVNIATNGEDAVSRFEAYRPHVVLLDIRMPGMSGIDVLCKIKKFDDSIKVVMLSAFGDEAIVKNAFKMGADHYIQKPMKLKQLTEILLDWQSSCSPGDSNGCQ